MKRTARDREEVIRENIIDQINRNFYMDDFLSSHSSLERLSTTTKTIIKVLSNGFRLTKWLSNDRSFLDTLPYSETSPKISEDQVLTEKIPGILCNFKTDLLSIKPIDKVFEDTKRGMLAFTSFLFDPIGMLTPFTLEPKLLIQELRWRKIEWDEIIPRDSLQRWDKWKVSFNQLQSVNIPRWYEFHQQLCNLIELHVFCDTSSLTYGAVAYFSVIVYDDISCRFVIAKSLLAPLKGNSLTIPKLELKAAVLAVRLKEAIVTETNVKPNSIYFWPDSRTVIKYICNENSHFPPYIMH